MPVDTALLRASVIYNESTVPANLAVGRMLRGPLVPLRRGRVYRTLGGRGTAGNLCDVEHA